MIPLISRLTVKEGKDLMVEPRFVYEKTFERLISTLEKTRFCYHRKVYLVL